MTSTKARIISTATYLPEKVLSNEDLEQMVETSDEWIQKRTGMRQRRIAAPSETASDLGAKAAQKALSLAKMDPSLIDCLLVATMSGDYITPSTASLIQEKIGAKKSFAFDISAACTGFIYALSVACAYIESGMARTVLLIATEKLSSFVNYEDRNTCVLFGDGAAACILTADGEGLEIGSFNLGCDGSLSDLIIVPAGGSKEPATHETVAQKKHTIKMEGREVFKNAVRKMCDSISLCLSKMNLSASDITYFVPHQANLRIMDAVAEAAGVASDSVFKTVHKYGNTSASGILIALSELLDERKLEKKERVLLVAFGAGLTWGSVILTKV